MRTIWNGSINFGLVNIPIGLAVAQQRKDVSFRTLHRECGTPIKQKRWCPFHERDVEADELVKGWEFAKGQFVMVEESDLEAVALTRSQSIDIDRFVDARRGRPDLLRPHVLPLAGRCPGAAAPVRPPAAGDAGGERRGDRQVRPLGQGEPLPDPAAGRVARARDALLRRGHPPREEIDDAVEETEVQRARARDGAPARREPRRRFGARRTSRTSTGRSSEGDARGEARGQGDRPSPSRPRRRRSSISWRRSRRASPRPRRTRARRPPSPRRARSAPRRARASLTRTDCYL